MQSHNRTIEEDEEEEEKQHNKQEGTHTIW